MERYQVSYFSWNKDRERWDLLGKTHVNFFSHLGIPLPAIAFRQAPEGCAHAGKLSFRRINVHGKADQN